jgi:hypothetical protein
MMNNVRNNKSTRYKVYHNNNKPQEKTSQRIPDRQHRNIRLTLISMPNPVINRPSQCQEKFIRRHIKNNSKVPKNTSTTPILSNNHSSPQITII